MEADLSRHGVDLRDLFLPGGGASRLTLRRLGVLVRHLPMESDTAKADGGHGFSMLELLVMEGGVGPQAQLNPRHPFVEAERAEVRSRKQLLKDRQAYYAAKSTGCQHKGKPVPVEVTDTLYGEPEVARWLCPDCGAEVSVPEGGVALVDGLNDGPDEPDEQGAGHD